MNVDPVPPNWSGRSVPSEAHAWLCQILNSYADLKPSMLQDFERRRITEIDFINGYVVNLGRQFGVPTPANAAVIETVGTITCRKISPDLTLLGRIQQAIRGDNERVLPIRDRDKEWRWRPQ
jgi:2-dehydropantoate 2-reductase